MFTVLANEALLWVHRDREVKMMFVVPAYDTDLFECWEVPASWRVPTRIPIGDLGGRCYRGHPYT